MQLGAPALDAVGARRLGRERVGRDPLGAGPHLAALAGQVRQLREALRRALVVVEHRRVELKLDELADLSKDGRGIGDQVLVAKLEVVRDLVALGTGALDPALPRLGLVAGRGRLAAALDRPGTAGDRDVPPVADQVDEPRLVAEHSADLGDRLDVDGRLVAPARLFMRRGVRGVEGADCAGRIAGRPKAGSRCERDA